MMIKTRVPFYSGTSGVALTIPKQSFPREFRDKSRLIYYSSLFNSVEINSSFYNIPRISTVTKWAESVPDNFQFTFKLWKAVTHSKGLTFYSDDVDQFLETIDHVGNKKGCLLVQFPPSLAVANAPQVEQLLMYLRKADPDHRWKIALEFRNKSWYQEEIYDKLYEFEVSMVVHDLPSSTTPLIDSKAGYVYLRFHGPGGRYRGSYTDEFLAEYARHISAWMNVGKTVYVYFNNTMGDAAKNLLTLNELVGV
ncbi:MAG: DUF72 domain-containing protein [Chitinophagaceae bacterium]